MSIRLAVLAVAVLASFIAGCVWFATVVERAPVSRSRLELFARRHDLVITVTNGDRVIRYLATARRWRATGLVGGLLISIGWNSADGPFRLDFLALFAGWFVGALVAEVRLARTPFGPRRAASLTLRQPSAYLPRAAWALLPVATVVSLAVGSATAVASSQGRQVGAAAVPLFAAAMLVAVVARAVQLRVLQRPQPIAEPDILAADDAIRSRSLHVLAGGGATLILYCVLGQLEALAMGLPGTGAQAIFTVNLLGIFLVPLLGWSVATARWPVRRDAGPATAMPANGTP